MDIYSLKRGSTSRAMAIAFVAYSALASGRGLIPHLCATLSSLPESGAAAHCAKPHSCCASPGDGKAMGQVPGDCAFCLIVHTPAHAAAQVAVALQYSHPTFECSADESRVADPVVSSANLCRAPPLD